MNGDFNNNTRIDDLISKSLDRQATVEEEKELQAWISKSEENRRHFTEMQYLWNHVATQDKPSFDSEAAFQRFKAHVAVKQTTIKPQRHNFYPWYRWVFVFLLAFLLIGFGIYIFNNGLIFKNKKQYSISVPVGAKTKIKLPDKSVVWLNSSSTLRYSQNFGIKNRDVSLIGEGYFEITRNPKIPFVVHTKQATVKVVGTKFDMSAYPDNEHIDVTLLKGSVQLKTIYQTSALTLKPNQKAIIDKKNQKVIVIHVAAYKSIAWTKGKFFFNYKSFINDVNGIERRYDIKKVKKSTQLNKLPFSDELYLKQSISEILNIITNNDEIHF